MYLRLFAVAVFALGIGVPSAHAGNHSNFGVERPGQTCAAAIHQKHPELKGKAFSSEWGKCKTDPAGYLKANS
jgi:hypothetical protein